MPDSDMALSYFKSLFLDITNKHAPLRKYKVKGRVNPWFTDHLSDKIHERHLAWAIARKSKSQSDWIHFRHLRNKCMSLIRKAKSDYYIKEMSDMKNTSKFWKVFKSMSSSTSDSVLPKEIRVENEIITDKTKMLYILNQHFIASDKLFEKEMPLKTAQNSSYAEQKLPFDFNVTPITINEVRDALKKINIKKSAGPDGLDPHLLQIAAEIIVEPLTHIFNLTIENGQIPKIWKAANVVPLLKGGDPANPNNYRPISKLSVLGKILEGLISNQLKEFLSKNCILNDLQSGFRKKHGTVTATMKVLNDITAIDEKEHCAALFLDLSKAFDTVDHSVLLQKLVNIGFSSKSVKWFENYLSDRTQSVQADGLSSSCKNPFWVLFYL